MKPKEGTILTVAKGAAEKAAELAPESEDLNAFIEDVLAHAEYVLSQTPEMLPVLKEAGVVDSGGQGLLTVLQGAYDAFLGKEIDLNFEMPEAKTEFVRPSKETEKKSNSATAPSLSLCWKTRFRMKRFMHSKIS